MIIPCYQILPSSIPNAGQGLFLAQAITKGSIVTAPDQINQLFSVKEVEALAPDTLERESSVRWFENYCTISTGWPDECYINHSFNPTTLWHLGFTFALQDYPEGTEMTLDYRLFLLENDTPGFEDTETGQAILGLPWMESLKRSTEQLHLLLRDCA